MIKSATDKYLHEIAVIGMACRFPGAKSVEQFWHNLREGVESITFFSDEQLLESGLDPSVLSNPNYVKANGILEDIDLFDASFFGSNPREAELMDPQVRFFLEVAWEALERASYDADKYDGLIGVFGGVGKNYYLVNNILNPSGAVDTAGILQTSLMNDNDFLATNVSYKLNLKGPSITVQTACSTSLVAIHIACQSLLNGECDMAMAGGVSITELRKQGYLYNEGGIHSSDGHCRPFDEKASGTVGGNGVGIVVLKRLSSALQDGDQILAVVKGSALNNDGSLKAGFSAPSVDGQARVIGEALAVADVSPESVTFVETHGTGTNLGDPIEVAALTQAFRAGTQGKAFCALGAVKSNVGHTNSAAGVTGFIKTVLALEHKQLPPTLHFEKPNPKTDLLNSPFYVNTELAEWKTGKTPRRAGVSAFGMGGTNAHIILEEAPLLEKSGKSRPYQLLPLSAKTKAALEKMTTNLADKLENSPELNLADVSYTLQVGRKDFSHRRMLVCQNSDEAVKELQEKSSKNVVTAFHEPGEKSVAFMFPGQGTQHVNMGKEIYGNEPKFREMVDKCCELLLPNLGLDLREILYPKNNEEEATEKLKQTAITQPALFVIEYALAQLWISWGIRPQAMIGHSIGEYVAACLAGVFSLEDALALVAARGRLMQSMPAGSMLAISCPVAEVEPLLNVNDRISLAAVNAPELCVVSGPSEEIDEFEKQLAAKEVACRRLHTSHAFHSEMMDSILEPFKVQVAKLKLSAPKIPFISNVTGTWITNEKATDPDYWAQHLRRAVKFADGAFELLKEPARVLIEVGPGRTLNTLASMCLFGIKEEGTDGSKQAIVSSMRRPDENESDVKLLLSGLGRLWLAGVEIDWSRFYKSERRRRVLLPTYPFERHRYWVKEQVSGAMNGRAPLQKNPDIGKWFYVPSWKRSAVPHFTEASIEKRSCLVFSNECELSSKLIKRLETVGHNVFVVSRGKEFLKQNKKYYQINSKKLQDYNDLFKQILELDKNLSTIVYLWNMDIEGNLNELESEFYSLLSLAHALGDRNFSDPLNIEIISTGLQEVLGGEVLQPEKATLLGPCKVITQELSGVVCRSIDIVLPEEESEETRLIEQLIAEIHSEPTEPIIAYRGNHRWIQSFEPTHLDKNDSSSRLREGGVYLVTGGLGGIGLALAEHLAKTVKAKLVLIGRKDLPPKDEWNEWVAKHDDADSTSQKITKVQALEALGAEVMVAGADVSNLKQMEEVVKKAKQRFGSINGLIHSAGVPGGGMIQLKTFDSAAAILAPKVAGTIVLDKLFKNEKLDFMALCSSLASTFGGIGQIDYCAANAFMDAFALHASKNGRFTVSISWDTWQEVGMAVNTEVPDELKAQRDEALLKGMTPEEGMEAFSRILQSSQPHVLVSTSDLLRRIAEGSDHWKTRGGPEDPEETGESESMHARPGLSTEYVVPSDDVEKGVADIWQKLFGIEQIGLHDDFFELGGHSLLATQLLNKLRKNYEKVEFSLRSFFDNATVAGVVKLIEKTYGTESKNGLLQKFLNTDLSKDRKDLIESYLKEKLAQIFKIEIEEISPTESLMDRGLDSVTSDLIFEIKRDFGLRIYPDELMKNHSIQELANFIATEMDRMDRLQEIYATSLPPINNDQSKKQQIKRSSRKLVKKNETIIFLLTAPRSGSTLLRIMLSGHSNLFCPPELSLLAFSNVKDWIANERSTFSKDSVIRNLLMVTGLDYDACQAIVEDPGKMSIQQVYGLIQEYAGKRILVDKTPGYTRRVDTLERAEDMFENTRYIYLYRHPYPVIDSFVRNRLDKFLGVEDVDPYWYAEKFWASSNDNVIKFFESIDEERTFKVRYETLVRDPEKVMRDVCDFLNIGFEEALLYPYEKGEMIAGPGDPDVFQHDKIDSSLGETWKKMKLPRLLSDFSQQVAAELNYELPVENSKSAAEIEKIDQSNAKKLLANLDNLSDEEVNVLLNDMLTSEGKENV